MQGENPYLSDLSPFAGSIISADSNLPCRSARRAAHKSWWDAKTGYAYLSGTQPGWRGQHVIIYDLKNPYHPKFVANWGLPEQRPGHAASSGVSLHHPVVSGNRAYLSYLFGGDVVILDITDKNRPKMISRLDFSSPYSGIHTTIPFPGIKVSNFTKGIGDLRDGSKYEVLKKFPSAEEIRAQVENVSMLQVTELQYYWLAEYTMA